MYCTPSLRDGIAFTRESRSRTYGSQNTIHDVLFQVNSPLARFNIWHKADAIHNAAQADIVVVSQVAQVAATMRKSHC